MGEGVVPSSSLHASRQVSLSFNRTYLCKITETKYIFCIDYSLMKYCRVRTKNMQCHDHKHI